MPASVEKQEIRELDPYQVRAGCCDTPKFWVMILSEAPLRCGWCAICTAIKTQQELKQKVASLISSKISEVCMSSELCSGCSVFC